MKDLNNKKKIGITVITSAILQRNAGFSIVQYYHLAELLMVATSSCWPVVVQYSWHI
jgi:hypothetical protein